jgi:hypothetical protein
MTTTMSTSTTTTPTSTYTTTTTPTGTLTSTPTTMASTVLSTTLPDPDSCTSFPCSLFSTSCTDILNVPDSPAGRTCGACITGHVGNGSVCTEQSVSAIQNLTCFCAAQSGWFKTACGSVDTRICSTKVSGYERRRCLANNTWESPVYFCEG